MNSVFLFKKINWYIHDFVNNILCSFFVNHVIFYHKITDNQLRNFKSIVWKVFLWKQIQIQLLLPFLYLFVSIYWSFDGAHKSDHEVMKIGLRFLKIHWDSPLYFTCGTSGPFPAFRTVIARTRHIVNYSALLAFSSYVRIKRDFPVDFNSNGLARSSHSKST